MNPSDFRLGDDGTFDTVIVCRKCGAEMRYNFQMSDYPDDANPEAQYDQFVEWAKEDAAEEHDCAETKDFEREAM